MICRRARVPQSYVTLLSRGVLQWLSCGYTARRIANYPLSFPGRTKRGTKFQPVTGKYWRSKTLFGATVNFAGLMQWLHRSLIASWIRFTYETITPRDDRPRPPIPASLILLTAVEIASAAVQYLVRQRARSLLCYTPKPPRPIRGSGCFHWPRRPTFLARHSKSWLLRTTRSIGRL